MAFSIRQFHDEQTLGEKLLTLRKEARLTLSELEEKTKIQKKYLKAFETGAFHKLPDPIYSRHYLKRYVQTLGGNEEYFLDQFDQERGTCDIVKSHQVPRQKARAIKFFVASRMLKVAVFVLFIGSLCTYIGFEVKTIIAPPQITIVSPVDGASTKEATILVRGRADHGTNLQINGEAVLLSQDGTFQKEIALERGLNVLSIQGAKRYSHQASQYRRVIFDNSKAISAENLHVDNIP
jgi:cytoskeletal protein RodZ